MSDAETMQAVATEAHRLASTEAAIHGYNAVVLIWDFASGGFQIVGGGNVTILVGLLTRAANSLDAQVQRYTGQGQPQNTPPPEAPPSTPPGTLS